MIWTPWDRSYFTPMTQHTLQQEMHRPGHKYHSSGNENVWNGPGTRCFSASTNWKIFRTSLCPYLSWLITQVKWKEIYLPYPVAIKRSGWNRISYNQPDSVVALVLLITMMPLGRVSSEKINLTVDTSNSRMHNCCIWLKLKRRRNCDSVVQLNLQCALWQRHI